MIEFAYVLSGLLVVKRIVGLGAPEAFEVVASCTTEEAARAALRLLRT